MKYINYLMVAVLFVKISKLYRYLSNEYSSKDRKYYQEVLIVLLLTGLLFQTLIKL